MWSDDSALQCSCLKIYPGEKRLQTDLVEQAYQNGTPACQKCNGSSGSLGCHDIWLTCSVDVMCRKPEGEEHRVPVAVALLDKEEKAQLLKVACQSSMPYHGFSNHYLNY